MAKDRLTPAKIMQLGTGFWGSKALLSAIELGLFTELAKGPLDAADLTRRLQLHPRSARDFFDALVALDMLKRTGSRYANTTETACSSIAVNHRTWAAFLKCVMRGSIDFGVR